MPAIMEKFAAACNQQPKCNQRLPRTECLTEARCESGTILAVINGSFVDVPSKLLRTPDTWWAYLYFYALLWLTAKAESTGPIPCFAS